MVIDLNQHLLNLEKDHEDWQESLEEIYNFLKPLLHGQKGLIQKYKVRTKHDEHKKERIRLTTNQFLDLVNITNLDEEIHQYGKQIFKINRTFQNVLFHDYLRVIQYLVEIDSDQNLLTVLRVLNGEITSSAKTQSRFNSIIARIFSESAGQGNKSQAGDAAELIANTLLGSVGLIEGKHYRTQFKSRSGSDTDFAFPVVDDYKIQDVEVFMGVQISTNDRARLIGSELKEGGERYLFSCNGMSFSSKRIKDIGDQIISSFKNSNVKLICYEPEIRSEINRINKRPLGKEQRLDYLENFTVSFQSFAEKMQARYNYIFN